MATALIHLAAKQKARLARSANESAGRSMKRLDETIAYVGRILQSMRKAP